MILGRGSVPLYWRLLRLRRLRPRPAVTFLLFEGSIGLAVLLVMAEVIEWWTAFMIPVANWNTALATSSAIDSRSSPWSGDVTGGHAHNRGITDHSFASSSGTAARPTFKWRPCVTA